MDDRQKFICARIAELRKQKGVSSRQMSYELGYSRGYINNIVSGKKLPSLIGLLDIIEYFEITPRDFFHTTLVAPKFTQDLFELVQEMSEKDLAALIYIAKRMKGSNLDT